MSPVGSTSEEAARVPLVLRPTVRKTFVKGIIAVAVFSVFLQLSLANLVHYLIFLAICLCLISAFAALKRSSRYELREDSILVKRLFRSPNLVSYQDILDISVSQGMLARRFHCGTVFFLLKGGKGSVRVMGGGIAEQLDDVPYPERVYELVTSRLSPFSPFVEP